MTDVERDVVHLLTACRMIPFVPRIEDLAFFSGLSPERLWAAGKIISDTMLVPPPDGGAGNIVWPTDDAVLEKYRQTQGATTKHERLAYQEG